MYKKTRVAKRRTILSRTKTLFRFLGLGHMRGVGMGLPYRQRFQFLLELIYGETFKPKAFWARHPDPDEFFYALFRVAKPDLERNAFVGDVFELSSETLHNEVNAQALERLGITTEELLALFKSNAAVEHPQEQKPKASAGTNAGKVEGGNTSVVFVPTPMDETGYNPNIPAGWRPGPTRGKRDRGSKGHSGVFLTEQALKVVGQNAPVRTAKSNKCLEQQKAFTASGKVDVAATAVNTSNQNKRSGTSKTTANTGNKAANGASKGTKRPRSTKTGFQALKKGGGGGADMLDGLVQAALLSQMDNEKEEQKKREAKENEEKKAKEKEAKKAKEEEAKKAKEEEAKKAKEEEEKKTKLLKKETEKQPKSKLERLMLEHLNREPDDNTVKAKDEKAKSNDENHNGNVKKNDQHAASTKRKEESASPGGGGAGGGEGGAPLEEEDFDDAIPTLPLDDEDLDTWERFDAWRAPLEEDEADCRAKHRTNTDRIEDVYSMFDQVMNDVRSPPSSQQHHQLTNNQTVLRDATARAQKLLGIEYVLKGMSNDLEQCLDDDVTLRSAKNHLAKISEIVSRKMNQQLG